jgi:predicted Holliday junction resolvase-like endonuclease
MVVISGFIVFLLLVLLVVLFYVVFKLGAAQKDAQWEKKLVRLRSDIADKQRAGVKGKVAEMFAPYLGDFPFKPSECKFLGDPIDYVVFEGLDNRDITGIHFVDVKADTAQLKKHQRQVRDIINQKGRMSFVTYHVDTKRLNK